MGENRNFVIPVNMLTPIAHTPFSWVVRHTTVCLVVVIGVVGRGGLNIGVQNGEG